VRIFLSYASEQRALAEPLALALRARDHKVFFDKDDLPPGHSYDIQIEQALGLSDIMIFLISPESIATGRYTLTELAFARRRWPSANGRIYPVLCAPTDLSRVPSYLSSVHVLTPEGNMAAEVAAVIDGIVPRARPGQILPFALIGGAASGLLTALINIEPIARAISEAIPFTVDPTRMVSTAFTNSYGLAPFLLSPVIIYIFIRWNKTGLLKSFMIPICLIIGWIVAFNTAYAIVLSMSGVDYRPELCDTIPGSDAEDGETLSKNNDNDPKRTLTAEEQRAKELCDFLEEYRSKIQPKIQRLGTVLNVFAGLSAGFAGSMVMLLFLRIVAVRLKPLDASIVIVATGTLSGALLALRTFASPGLHESVLLIPLFVVWQALVTAAIAWQFTKPERTRD
jgi:hypothetical protein